MLLNCIVPLFLTVKRNSGELVFVPTIVQCELFVADKNEDKNEEKKKRHNYSKRRHNQIRIVTQSYTVPGMYLYTLYTRKNTSETKNKDDSN